MREYIHYFSDIFVPYGEETSREVSFTQKNGGIYLDFSKVTQFDRPTFVSENKGTRVYPDKMALAVETQEKDNLLNLPVSDRVKELKKPVIMRLKDFDSGEQFGYILTPYLNRFTYRRAAKLLESLSEDKRMELLSARTKEYRFDKEEEVEKGILSAGTKEHRFDKTGVAESIVWERLRRSKDIRDLISSENKKKLDETLKTLQENKKNHFREPIGRAIYNLIMDRLLG